MPYPYNQPGERGSVPNQRSFSSRDFPEPNYGGPTNDNPTVQMHWVQLPSGRWVQVPYAPRQQTQKLPSALQQILTAMGYNVAGTLVNAGTNAAVDYMFGSDSGGGTTGTGPVADGSAYGEAIDYYGSGDYGGGGAASSGGGGGGSGMGQAVTGTATSAATAYAMQQAGQQALAQGAGQAGSQALAQGATQGGVQAAGSGAAGGVGSGAATGAGTGATSGTTSSALASAAPYLWILSVVAAAIEGGRQWHKHRHDVSSGKATDEQWGDILQPWSGPARAHMEKVTNEDFASFLTGNIRPTGNAFMDAGFNHPFSPQWLGIIGQDWFGSGKDRDQIQRDKVRDWLRENKMIDENYNLELLGAKFDVGRDGDQPYYNVGYDGSENFDPNDPKWAEKIDEHGAVIGAVNPIAAIMSGGDPMLTSSWAGYFTNAVIQTDDQDAAIKELWAKTGMTREIALEAVDALDIDEETKAAYRSAIDVAFDEDRSPTELVPPTQAEMLAAEALAEEEGATTQ